MIGACRLAIILLLQTHCLLRQTMRLAVLVVWRPFLEALLNEVVDPVELILDGVGLPDVRLGSLAELFIQLGTDGLEVAVPVWSLHSVDA